MTIAYHADSSKLVDKEVLTWETFGTACRELATLVADSSFRPEILVAVARGGLLPGGGLSYALGIKLTDAINVEFYTDVEETLPEPVLLAPHLDIASIAGRHILVVDDVADSGRTLALVLDLLQGVACLLPGRIGIQPRPVRARFGRAARLSGGAICPLLPLGAQPQHDDDR